MEDSMSDLVERLREFEGRNPPWGLLGDAADEITRLTAEVERLRDCSQLCCEEIGKLRAKNERLRAAIAWIAPPFVDEFTSAAELRQRIGFCVADAKRAALPQPTTEAPAP
jgi:hypothetical protein